VDLNANGPSLKDNNPTYAAKLLDTTPDREKTQSAEGSRMMLIMTTLPAASTILLGFSPVRETQSIPCC
jgi:hypothetical protein